MSVIQCTLALPDNFRVADLLKFHRRDPLAFSERVADETLSKGMLWHNHPACLSICFQGQQALVKMSVDDTSTATDSNHRVEARDTEALAGHVTRMLGLTQAVETFEAQYCEHPQLAPLLARQSGLRVPLAGTPFEALTWAITGQQISVGAAVAMRRKLIKATALVHSSGLACHPDAGAVAELTAADFRSAGFSSSKAQTLTTISSMVLSGDLPLDDWHTSLPVDEIRERLLAIRGIGPWTVNYTLLRGFGWLDGSLHGDVAVRRALQMLPGNPVNMSEGATKNWLAQFTPWRALVGAHLWASLSLNA